MFWHIDADIICIFVILSVYICSRKMPATDRASARNIRFSRCMEMGIGITVVDIIASVVMEVPVPALVYHLFMTAYFVCIELVIVEWFLYVLTILYPGDGSDRAPISRAVLAVYGVYAVFVCLNPWTELIYRLGPNNEYARGPFFAVMIVLFAIYTVVLFGLIIARWRFIPKEFPSWVLLMTPLIITVGIAVQLLVPGWLMIMPSYMICLMLAFLFLQSMRVISDQKLVEDLSKAAETDSLTGLFNRVGMEAMVQKTLDDAYGQRVLVLIMDIDDLKTINDTLGHQQGDRAIHQVAAQLRKHFRSGDTVVRYGGDEFLVFFTGSFSEEQMRESLRRLVAEISELRIGEDDAFPLHGSVGAAFGIVGRDTFETLCAQADIALYHVKRNGKNGFALYNAAMAPR